MFYITQSGQVYSGDPQNNDRQLTEEEAEIVRNGHYYVVNNEVVDESTLPGYSQNTRINEINFFDIKFQKLLNFIIIYILYNKINFILLFIYFYK